MRAASTAARCAPRPCPRASGHRPAAATGWWSRTTRSSSPRRSRGCSSPPPGPPPLAGEGAVSGRLDILPLPRLRGRQGGGSSEQLEIFLVLPVGDLRQEAGDLGLLDGQDVVDERLAED